MPLTSVVGDTVFDGLGLKDGFSVRRRCAQVCERDVVSMEQCSLLSSALEVLAVAVMVELKAFRASAVLLGLGPLRSFEAEQEKMRMRERRNLRGLTFTARI